MSNYNGYRNKKYKYYESSSYQPGQGQGTPTSQNGQNGSGQGNYSYNRPYYQGHSQGHSLSLYNQGYYNNYYNYKPKYKRKRFDKGSHYSPGFNSGNSNKNSSNQGYGDDRRDSRRDERYDRRNSYDEYRPKPAFELNLKLRSESIERDWQKEESVEPEWESIERVGGGEREGSSLMTVEPVFKVGEEEKMKEEEEKVKKLEEVEEVEKEKVEEEQKEEKVEEKEVKVEEDQKEEEEQEEQEEREEEKEVNQVIHEENHEKSHDENHEENHEENQEEHQDENQELKEQKDPQERQEVYKSEQEDKEEKDRDENPTNIKSETFLKASSHFLDDQDNYEDNFSQDSDSDAETVISDSAPTTSNAVKLMKEINPDKKKPYVIKRDASGSSLLQRACKKGNLSEVKALIQRGASPNESDFCGFTCLHEAALNGDAEIVKYLIEHGADVNKQALPDGDLETPLIDAADNKHLEIVKILLENGADPRIYNSDGFTALTKIHNQHQDEDGYDEIIKLLEEAHSKYVEKTDHVDTVRSPSPNTIIEDPNDTYFNDLLKKKNHTAQVYKYSAEGIKDLAVQYIVEGGRLDLKPDILILAARNGHLELVDIMLGLVGDYDIDLVNNCGLTALLASVGRGHYKVIEFLLDRGANPFLRRKPDNLNALEISQRSPNFDVKEIELIERYMKKNPNHSILSKPMDKRRSEEPDREVRKKVKVEKKEKDLTRTVSSDLDKVKSNDKNQLSKVKSNDKNELSKVKSNDKNELSKIKSNDKNELSKVKSNDKNELDKVKSNDKSELDRVKTPESKLESKQTTPKIKSPSPAPEPTQEELEMRARREQELKIYQEKVEAKKKARREMFLKSEREKERKRIEDEQKLLEEKKQLEILKKQEDENKLKQIELETQRIQGEKYQKRMKLKWDNLPIGLKTMKTKDLSTKDILRYCPVYIFTINDKQYVIDLQVTLVTGISTSQITSSVPQEDQYEASTTEKSKLWNLFSPLIGNTDPSKPIATEALIKGHEQFQSLVIKFISLDPTKQLLKEKAPLTHSTVVEGDLFTKVDFATINSFQTPQEKQKDTPISLEFVPFMFRNRPDLIKAAHELKTSLW